MTDTPAPSRSFWLVVMVACLVVAIVSAVTLVVLLLTDDDEGIPDAIPLIGDDDDDEDFERPVLEFVELEGGETLQAEPQAVDVRVTHPVGVESVQFYVEGSSDILTATGAGSTDITVQFPFVPSAPGEYTLVAEAVAVDGTAAEPIEVTVNVKESDEPVDVETATPTPE